MAYKSDYYDPQKAHEYYMKHRKLKGKRSKTSTAGFSNKQKEASLYVKSQINAKQKSALKKHTEDTKAQRKQMQEKVSKELSGIRAKIKQINSNSSLSNNQKAQLRGELREQLAKIAEDYKTQKEKFNQDSKTKRESIRNSYKRAYEKEHKKIRKDKSMKKRR